MFSTGFGGLRPPNPPLLPGASPPGGEGVFFPPVALASAVMKMKIELIFIETFDSCLTKTRPNPGGAPNYY